MRYDLEIRSRITWQHSLFVHLLALTFSAATQSEQLDPGRRSHTDVTSSDKQHRFRYRVGYETEQDFILPRSTDTSVGGTT